MDIVPKNGKFTWSEKILGLGNIKEILDKFLIREKIISDYNSVISKIIPLVASDHKPTSIKIEEGENLGPDPF